MNIIGLTIQVRVNDFNKGVNWYTTLFDREPDFTPHDHFVEWKLTNDTWLQVSKGEPSQNSGPIRLGVKDIHLERERISKVLHIEIEPVQTRKGVPAAWCTFSDPWENRIGLYEDLL
ncbi:VOC family protein [Bacillus sp. AK128]